MGLKVSKSPADPRTFLLGLDGAGKSSLFRKLKESFFSVRAVQYIEMEQRAGAGKNGRRRNKLHWSHLGQDTSGLVYVMDDPTGGVWMKPKESLTRYWEKNA